MIELDQIDSLTLSLSLGERGNLRKSLLPKGEG